MSIRAWREKRREAFHRRYPGCEKRFADIGQGGFQYIAYLECNAAAVLELCGILTVIFTVGAAVVYLREHPPDHAAAVFLWLIGVYFSGIPFRVLARVVNNVSVRKRIRTDSDYAYYFAWKYPEQKALCAELNAQYEAYPDAVPAAVFAAKAAMQEKRERPLRRILCVVGIGILAALMIGFVLFCLWVKHETE